MYLAIDTATNKLGLALLDGQELVGEVTWRTKQNHTAELIPAILYLLDRARTDLHSLRGIIVAKGPGSFTGLRVGITTAKGFAISTGVPLVGVGTLEGWSYVYAGLGPPVCAILESGRGELAAALYRWLDGESDLVVPEHLTSVEDLCGRIQEHTIFCGDLSKATCTQLKEQLGDKALIPSAQSLGRRAAFLGELGRQRIERGEADNPSTLQPLYLRSPSITRPSRTKAK